MQMAQALSRGTVIVKDAKSFQQSKAGGPQSCGGDRGPKHLPLESLGHKQGNKDMGEETRPWRVACHCTTPHTQHSGWGNS